MARLLILATRNRHKAREIRQILTDRLSIQTLDDYPGAPTTIEDQDSFAGNAAKKALDLATWIAANHSSTLASIIAPGTEGAAFVVADDSGLEVDALGGAPGVHSARFAYLGRETSGNAPDAENNLKLLHLLDGVLSERRSARFRCVIALAAIERGTRTTYHAHPKVQLFEGACEGAIRSGGEGTDGFGYDPLFVPNGFDQTFAQIGDEAKNRISHRAAALRKMSEWLGAR